MQRTETGLYHVSQINWADDTIHRAGIIPFYNKRNKELIGLGVTKVTAVLVILGGTFEERDTDLFATAVREYNEETGSKITEFDVSDCFAVVNKGTINILLPLDDRPKFKVNDEIERIMWLTTKQLEIIGDNQDYFFSAHHHTTHLLTASRSLINELPLLIASINSGLPLFRSLRWFRYRRLKKTPEVKHVRLSTNFDQLRFDMTNPSLFYGSASMVIRGDYISFQRRDKVIYSFTMNNYDDFMKFVGSHKIKIYVGFMTDFEKYSNLLDLRRLYCIEARIKKLLNISDIKDKIQSIWTNFQMKVKEFRQLPDKISVTLETILIHETEEQIYRLTENTYVTVNNVRSAFLETFDLVNQYISDVEGTGTDVLIEEIYDYILENRTNKSIRIDDAIDIMIDLSLILADDYIVTIK